MKYRKRLSGQHGVSLVEVLAVIVILSIVGVLLFSIISSGQKQYTEQSAKNQDLKEISYKLKVLTKDIRKATSVESSDPNSFIVKTDGSPDVKYSYTPPENEEPGKLKKEDDDFLTFENEDDVFEFYVKDIYVTSIEIKVQNISTKIFVRSGD